MGDLEILYLKAVDLPIHIKEIEQLNLKLSAVKVYIYIFGIFWLLCGAFLFTKVVVMFCGVISFNHLAVIAE